MFTVELLALLVLLLFLSFRRCLCRNFSQLSAHRLGAHGLCILGSLYPCSFLFVFPGFVALGRILHFC